MRQLIIERLLQIKNGQDAGKKFLPITFLMLDLNKLSDEELLNEFEKIIQYIA